MVAMPLRRFVDLGHSESHCHPVANACTTEMQVTSSVPRPSTPHTTWMKRSVEGLGARLSSWPTWPWFTVPCICDYRISLVTTTITTYYDLLVTFTTHCTNYAVASRLWCVILVLWPKRCSFYSLMIQSLSLVLALMTSLNLPPSVQPLNLPPSIVRREEQTEP